MVGLIEAKPAKKQALSRVAAGFKPAAAFRVNEGSLPPLASGILQEVGDLNNPSELMTSTTTSSCHKF
jgi:hypothetical protein